MSARTVCEASGHAHRIYEVVDRGSRGETSDLVASSWVRCLKDYRLDPSRPSRPQVLDKAILAERCARCADLIDCAKLEMTTLYQQLGDTDLAVVLVDTDGVILHMVASPDFSQDVSRMGLRVGAVWSEAEVGTNGMGTCLVSGEPVAVRQHEHFFAEFTSLTCSAVPIFDPEGKLTAALDVTSRSQLMQQHSLVLLGMTAQMIACWIDVTGTPSRCISTAGRSSSTPFMKGCWRSVGTARSRRPIAARCSSWGCAVWTTCAASACPQRSCRCLSFPTVSNADQQEKPDEIYRRS